MFANLYSFSVLLQAVDIRQIYDKFPEKKGGLKELYDKGPQPVFFLVKFWVSLNNFCRQFVYGLTLYLMLSFQGGGLFIL